MTWAAKERTARSVRRRREALIQALGGVCAACGTAFSTDLRGRVLPLEIDHQEGRDWDMARLSQHRRIARLWREYRAGVPLRVLCRSCNARLQPPQRKAA